MFLLFSWAPIGVSLFTAVKAKKKGFRMEHAQGIEAEIPEALGTKAEELERKARFPALCAGNAPK